MAGHEGATLGAYRLMRRLGGGVAGDVYLATGPIGQASAGQANSVTGAGTLGQVAVKLIAGGAGDPTAREIARQAQQVGAMRQPHIIPLYDVVEQDGALGVVMAYAPGGSLGDMVTPSDAATPPRLTLPLSIGVVARLITQLARALAAAHAAGMTHGDLKLTNIFVRTSPAGAPLAVIGDFGQGVVPQAAAALVARGVAQPQEQTQWVGQQLRTMAPEQLRGETTPAADQYALATIAYMLLTGRYPFSGALMTMASAIMQQAPTPPSTLNPEVTPEAEATLLRALAKDPQSRYASIEQFAQAFDDALAAEATAGMTVQFSRLAAGGDVTTTGASRATGRPAGATGAPRGAQAPADAPLTINRRLAALTGVALLVSIVSCSFIFHAFSGAVALPSLSGNAQAPSIHTQGTATPNPAATAFASSAVMTLHQATNHTPIFSDPLRSNQQGWSTSGKQFYIAADGLHINNSARSNVAALDAPQPHALRRFVAQATVTMLTGSAGDLAGVTFLASQDGSVEDYYAFLIAPEGRYEAWLHTIGGWHFITSGYSSAIKTGLRQSNTIDVLTRANDPIPDALFYVNDQYVTSLTLENGGPTSGWMGLIVLNGNVEARFTDVAVFNATKS